MIQQNEAIYTEELYQLRPPVVIVLGDEWSLIPEHDKVLLGRILASVKLSLNGVKILHSKTIMTNDFADGSTVISFGVAFGPELQRYEIKEEKKSVFIFADPLSALDDVSKKNLWGVMKKAFGF